MEKGSFKFFYILTPLITTTYPIIRIYLFNIESIPVIHLLLALIITSLLVLILFIVSSLIYKNYIKGSFFTILFFITIHVFHYLSKYIFIPISMHFFNKTFYGIRVFRISYILLPLSLLFAVYYTVLLYKTKKINFFHIKIFLIPFFALYSVTLIQIGTNTYKKQQAIKQYKLENEPFRISLKKHALNLKRKINNKKLPDIYFIILDSYASDKHLLEMYNYNNSQFTQQLKNIGFTVINDGRSNYPYTMRSLPATLNMCYLPSHISPCPTNYMWKNNNTYAFFKSLGYEIINLGVDVYHSEKTNLQPKKSILLQQIKDFFYGWESFFHAVIQEHIILSVLFRNMVQRFLSTNIDEYFYKKSRSCIKTKLNSLQNLYKISNPKFVYAHFTCPHIPYVFDKEGKDLPVDTKLSEQEKYCHSLQFINKKIMDIFLTILNKSSRLPIIIVQGDHSPLFSHPNFHNLVKQTQNNSKLRNIVAQKQLDILNAVYLPKKNIVVPNDLTPVNNFRFLIKDYFETKIPILKNKFFGINKVYFNTKKPGYFELP
jgi:hypothetical protein